MSAEKPLAGLSKREQLTRLLEKRATQPRHYPLSFAQQRLWFLDRLSPGNPAYNVSLALGIPCGLRREVLAASLRELVRRHGTLRTRFAEVDGEPVQVVSPAGEPAVGAEVRVLDLSGLPEDLRQVEAARAANSEIHAGFDLERGPLLRVTWIERGLGQVPALLVVLHHIVADGWSADVLMRETLALCAAFAAGRPSPLPELPVQYADYVLAQRQWLKGEVLAEQIAFWRDRLAGIPPLELPADRPRPPVQTFRGTAEVVWLSPESTAAVRALAQRAGATPFMVLLAAFQAFLFRYTGQEVLAVGSPVAGRPRRELEGLIGLFVNMVVLRADLDGDPPFEAFFEEVRRWTAEALSHQEMPFEKLVEALQPERDPSRTPLFQAAFVLQGAAAPSVASDVRIPDLQSSVDELGSRETAKFDLTLELVDRGEIFSGVLELNLDLFDAETGRRMGRHLKTLLKAALSAPATRLSELPLLDEGERSQILHAGQHTQTPTADPRSLHDLFAEQAARQPDAPAVTFEGVTLSYGELSARADRLAAVLRGLGAGPEQIIGLFAERSPRLVVGILGILRAGGAYLPLDPGYPAERLDYLLDDSGARLVVVDEPLRGRLPGEGRTEVSLQESAEGSDLLAPAAPLPNDPDHLAYVIYTSGSTGQPKGALLTHANVVRLLTGTAEWFGFGPDDVWTLFHSFAFDFSVWEIWGALAFGGRLVVVPQSVSREPGVFLDLLRRERVTVLNQTPLAFRQLVRAVEEERADPGSLALRWVIFGGEALEPAALAPWIERADAERPRLINMYGITETTVHVTWRLLTAADLRRADRSPIGAPIPDLSLHVLDGNLEPVPPGVGGELAVGGAGLARGYLGRPDLTALRFVPDPHAIHPGARLYRSGDRAHRLAGGELIYSGRIDQQVKIRGFRIEPGEIEAALAAHPRVREAVVLVREDTPGDRRLVAYFVASSPTPPSGRELREHLQGRLPEHMVPAAFVALESWPLTVNGKLDRRALPAPDWEGERDAAGAFVAPRDPIEEMLAGTWTEVLKVPRVGIDDDFFALGGHSLLATQVVSRIRTALGIPVPLQWLFERPTVRGLAVLVAGRLGEIHGFAEAPPLSPVPRPAEGMPLSYAQQRLWFLDRLQPGGSVYNIAAAVRLLGDLDDAALRRSFQEIARRHESLRTTFPSVEGRPVQRIAAPGEVPVPCIDLCALPEDARHATALNLGKAEAGRPFDLAAGPLLRVALLRLGEREHILLLTLHHIVSDGWSAGIITRELAALYGAAVQGLPSSLSELPIQYADFAAWQRSYLSGDVLEEQVGYWRRRLAGVPESLEMTTDRPRQPVQRLRGGGRVHALSPALSASLKALARAEGATLFMALLAGFQALLMRYTGQDDLVVGTPVAGRNRAETEGLIGFFVNTLALRGDLSGNPTFRELLARLRDAVLGDYAHQDLPFEKLVEDLAPHRELSRSPLFQVMLALQNAPAEPVALPGLTLAPAEVDEASTKFDLTLLVAEAGDRLIAGLGYDRDLFDAPTMARLLTHLEVLTAAAVAMPGRRLSGLPLLTPAEVHQARSEWNDTRALRLGERWFHELFADRAVSDPDRIAVETGELRWSYRELNTRADRLACRLWRLGAGPDVVIGLLTGRTPEMLLGLLGVLKAGAAFLPLDPVYPAERLSFLVEDSGATFVLAAADFAETVAPRLPAPSILLDLQEEGGGEDGASGLPERAHGDSLAYVIYTSGSTGRPKGVMVSHRALANLSADQLRRLELAPGRRTTLTASPSFDASLIELNQSLLTGATIRLFPGEPLIPGLDLARRFREAELDLLYMPTAVLAVMPADGLERITCVTFGGESCPPALAARWAPGRQVYDAYGPTEATIYCTLTRQEAGGRITIGRPMANVEIHLLDADLRPVPAGVRGELYVGGAGLARGYRQRPDLTAEKFVPDPLATWRGEPGARLYRTGDLARWLADGRLEYLGRTDGQMKIRGYRIELGEIEEALARHPDVDHGAVIARPDRSGQKVLAAFVVPRRPDLPVAELRQHLAEILPAHMVPASFQLVSELPRTTNGKVDRKALAAPEPAKTPAGSPGSAGSDLERAVAAIWRDLLGTDQLGLDDNFFDVGGHSLRLVEVQERLQKLLGREIPVVDLFRFPTIRSLASQLSLAQETTREAEGVRPALQTAPEKRADIAVIGMAGRFPGAADVEAFWDNLCRGVESVARFTEEDLLAAGVDPAVLTDPAYVPAGAVLEGVDQFDAEFFGYSPREAEVMDPQQRLFLQCAWHGLENAGYDPYRVSRPVGVYAGALMSTYALNLLSRPEILAAVGGVGVQTGIDKDFIATRVSYELGLKGPSLTVQTACSTSLVAIHLACQALRLRECDMALAGGSNIRLPQGIGYLYQEGDILSPDGHCRAFDARARGTLAGNAVAVVVLKRLEDALRDGDTVHAVVKGTAINNDGSLKVGFTAPSVDGQAGVIAAAQTAAGVSPDSIGYVEAHGTGTALGDPIEVAALTRAFRLGGSRDRGVCALGSLKTNVGHLDAAAGVAGFLKAVYAVERGQIPPSLHFEEPNPKIDFASSPFRVVTRLEDWPRGAAPRRAGISSFGIGGTNAHVVLEEPPAPLPSGPPRPFQLLVMSARTATGLEEISECLSAHLARSGPEDPEALADAAYTLQVGRAVFDHRRALVTDNAGSAAAALADGGRERVLTGRCTASRAPARIAFLFPGQGAQHPGMARGLYETEPLFRSLVDEGAMKLAPRLGLDLRQVLFPSDGQDSGPAAEALRQTRLAQPALFVIEHALARLWMSWGIVPRAMIGHSVGEYVAACLAGVFSFDDALGLVADRGELMQALPGGAMLSVELGEEELRRRTAGSRIAVAAVNGPALCVAAGPEEAIAGLARALEAEGISCRPLHTSHAFHSDAMDPILEAFEARVARVRLNPPTLPYVSNLTGGWVTEEQATSPAFWAAHLRRTVRFSQGIESLLASAPESGLVLLEVGPGKTLSHLVRPFAQRASNAEVVASLRHPREEGHDAAVLLGALARLWLAGAEVDWVGFHGGERRRRVPLPGYPFQTRRFWIEPARGRSFERERSDSGLYAPVWKGTPALVPGVPVESVPWLFAVGDPAFLDMAEGVAGILREGGSPVEVVTGEVRRGAPRIATFGLDLPALLRLTRSLPDRDVVLVTTGAQAVTAAESERQEDARPAAPAGLARALRWRSVDVQLPPAGWKQDRLARALAAELLSGQPGTATAYRDGERWLESFEPLPSSAATPRLAQGDSCTVIGADNPDAADIAERLERELGAHIVKAGQGGGAATLLYWIDAPPRSAAEGDPEDWERELSRALAALSALEEALRDEPVRDCVILTSTAAALGDLGHALGAAVAAVTDAFVRSHNQRDPAPWMRVSLDELDALPAESARRALRQIFTLNPASRVVVSALPPRARATTAAPLAAHERPELDTDFEAPREGTERRLAEIWRELLGIAEVGLHDDFFELGGHSLMATRLISRIRETFGRELPLEAVFQAPTVARLAARIESEEVTAGTGAVVPVQRDAELPLSHAQQRLLFLDVMNPGDVSYNLGLALRLQGSIDPPALGHAVDRLVERHEVLRTTFALTEGRAAQLISPAAPVPLPLTDLSALPPAAAEAELRRLAAEEAHRPLDLFLGPVVRAQLVRRLADEHALLLTVHHIAADGWSFGILYRELAELYEAAVEKRAPRLPALPVQYADFAAWQRSAPRQESLERQIDYWHERLAGAPTTELPGDRPRPPIRSGRGAEHSVAFPAPLAENLRRLGREQDSTPFMVLVSAFLAVLHYYLRGNDLVVGTDLANRTRSETEGLIGLFVNQLVLRNDLSGDPSFRELLDRVRHVTLEAYAHQDAPFDRLVEVLNPVRDMSRTPLFQIKIVLQNTPMEARALPGLVISPLGSEQRTAKFDLLLNLSEGPGGIQGRVEYTTDLYEPATIARLVERFGSVLETVVARPDIRLSEIVAELAQQDQLEQSQFLQEHRQARSRTVERVRRKAISVNG